MIKETAIVKPKLKLTRKEESFSLFYFKSGHGTNSAIAGGFSRKTARITASKLLTKPNIQARLAELKANLEAKNNGSAQDLTIANVEERQQRLTTIAREDIVTKHGPNRQQNIQAIAELNKMDHLYDESAKVHIDNRVLNIYVKDAETKDLILQVKDRTGKLVKEE